MAKPMENQTLELHPKGGGFLETLKSLGPGLVVAFAWLGTGDLVDASVSGANYGYDLMWVLCIALFCRYFFVNALAKYQLCNSNGDETIFHGFYRVWKGFPLLLGVSGYIMGFVYVSYMIRGTGVALYHLFGEFGNSFLWSIVGVLLAIYVTTRPRQLKALEFVARIACVVIIVTFIFAIFNTGINVGAFIEGLSFGIPANNDAFGALLISVSIIGAVGGSAANLLYPYLMNDKGWKGPKQRKLQIIDLLTGIVAIIVINLAIWIVAAETMYGQGQAIHNEVDLAAMMAQAVGPIGPLLLWITVFFVCFTSYPTFSFGFTKLLLHGLHLSTKMGEKYEKPEMDPKFKWFSVGGLLVVPLVFSMPFAPNLVTLTIVGNSLAVITAPVIIVGIIFMTSRKSLMLPEYVNKWWENLILGIVGCIGLWATYSLLMVLIEKLG